MDLCVCPMIRRREQCLRARQPGFSQHILAVGSWQALYPPGPCSSFLCNVAAGTVSQHWGKVCLVASPAIPPSHPCWSLFLDSFSSDVSTSAPTLCSLKLPPPEASWTLQRSGHGLSYFHALPLSLTLLLQFQHVSPPAGILCDC